MRTPEALRALPPRQLVEELTLAAAERIHAAQALGLTMACGCDTHAEQHRLATAELELVALQTEALRRLDPLASCTSPGECGDCWSKTCPQADPTPAPTLLDDGQLEPFCACGRRVSQCDGSRAGCRKP